jgi:hypothetical protein
MKSRVIIAFSIGVIASVFLAALEAKFPNMLFEVLQAPGFFTIIILWGPHGGGNVPGSVLETVMIGVNVVAYSLLALGCIRLFGFARSGARK